MCQFSLARGGAGELGEEFSGCLQCPLSLLAADTFSQPLSVISLSGGLLLLCSTVGACHTDNVPFQQTLRALFMSGQYQHKRQVVNSLVVKSVGRWFESLSRRGEKSVNVPLNKVLNPNSLL